MSVQEVPPELWGGETRKAVANFPVSGERIPVAVVRWLGHIKGAAARVNADLGLLDLDHVGAEVPQGLRTPRPRQQPAEIDHAHAGKRQVGRWVMRHALLSLRKLVS